MISYKILAGFLTVSMFDMYIDCTCYVMIFYTVNPEKSFIMPGHIKLVKGAVDPDPTEFLLPR